MSPAGSSYFWVPSQESVGNVSLENDRYSLRWSIPALGELQSETLEVKVRHQSVSGDPVTFDNNLYVHEFFGEVTTSSFESYRHTGNNTSRVWSYNYAQAKAFRQAAGNYSVAVSADNLSPSPGDTVNFTVTTDRARPSGYTGFVPPPIDLKVAIELTGGLSVVGSPSYVSKSASDQVKPKPASVSYGNGVFNVGTLKSNEPTRNSVILPITVASNSVGTQQCLTATLTGNPPPGGGRYDDDKSDNVAKVCLGAAPAGEQVVLRDGTVDLFTWYDCVAKTAAPCNEGDSLELVVTGDAAAEFGAVFQPSQTVVQVADPAGRTASSKTNDDSLVWSTGHPSFTNFSERAGVIIRDNTTDLSRDEGWGADDTLDPNAKFGRATTTVSGPGDMSIWYEYSNDISPLFTVPTINAELYYLELDDDIYAEFTRLGTYTFTLTAMAAHSGGNGDCDTDGDNTNDGFCDTETYTFHVGPIIDLDVAGGASYVPPGQTTFTIRAANNGPESAADAQIKVVLPTGALVEDYVASDGTYSNGVWTLPGLKLRDYRRSQGKPEEATLTLILKEGGGLPKEPATATISQTDNSYNVCIGTVGDSKGKTLTHATRATCEAHDEDNDNTGDGSWHEGTVYDYNAANNTAKIMAVQGTGGGGPGAPVKRGAESNSRSVTLNWGGCST